MHPGKKVQKMVNRLGENIKSALILLSVGERIGLTRSSGSEEGVAFNTECKSSVPKLPPNILKSYELIFCNDLRYSGGKIDLKEIAITLDFFQKKKQIVH